LPFELSLALDNRGGFFFDFYVRMRLGLFLLAARKRLKTSSRPPFVHLFSFVGGDSFHPDFVGSSSSVHVSFA